MKKNGPSVRWFFFLTPCLLAAYPVLNVISINAGKISPTSLYISLLVSFLIPIFFLGIFYLLFRKSEIAIIFASLGSFAFFTYGYFYEFAADRQIIGDIDPARLMIYWVLAYVAVGAVIYFFSQIWKPIREFSFYTGLVLCLWSLVTIFGEGPIFASVLEPGEVVVHTPQPGIPISATAEMTTQPDIYYIILDGYGRADILYEYFNFDNSDFIDFLEEKGFYVAEKSQSNYAQTRLSLPSSLNMDFLDGMINPESSVNENYSTLRIHWEQNAVFSQAEDLGYTTIFFDNGINFAKDTEADIEYRYSWLDDFYAVLIDKSVLRPYRIDIEIKEDQQIFDRSVHDIQKVPEIQGPTFTFLHLLAPHPPFIFDRNGKFPDYVAARENFRKLSWYPSSAYIDQLWYVNTQVEDIVNSILDGSDAPPIIVIQADHGPNRQEPMARHPILNAIYLPGKGSDFLYPSISPVNTFRLIYDYYFGTRFGVLEDHSWFSPYDHPFQFCDADDYVDIEMKEQSFWLGIVSSILSENNGRIDMSLNECDLGMFFASNDNLRGYEGEAFKDEAGFRWAGEKIEFRLPVLETGRDYMFSALVRNTLPISTTQNIKLVIEGTSIAEVPVPDNTDLQSIEFNIPSSYIGEKIVAYISIVHPFTVADHGHGNISLRYYGVEWKPVSAESP